MPKSIAILTNEYCTDILDSRYFLSHMARVWQQQGIQVHTTGGCNYIPADIAIVHVDSTIVADEYIELAARYPIAINGGVKDISKSSFSRQLLKKDDPYLGRVIVKTNSNYGGVIEYQMGLQSGSSIYTPAEFERPWRTREFLDSYNYPVFDSIKDVPPGVWKNKKLIAEKFLPERLDNGEYVHRCYLFFGEQEAATWFCAPLPAFKGSNSTSRGHSDHFPESFREIRESIGFGYGRFDYTESNGEANLFDMNKTPALGELSLTLMSEEMISTFADAIFKFE